MIVIAELLLAVILVAIWSRLGKGIFWDKPEDAGEDPGQPSDKVPFLFFGYLLSLILIIASFRGFAVRLASTTAFGDHFLIPIIALALGLALAVFCQVRGRMNRKRTIQP